MNCAFRNALMRSAASSGPTTSEPRQSTFMSSCSRETMVVDYDDVLELAKEPQPKLIVCGGSAYPRKVEADRFREIADEVDALLLCDMAHFAGLVAAGLHPNPGRHC